MSAGSTINFGSCALTSKTEEDSNITQRTVVIVFFILPS